MKLWNKFIHTIESCILCIRFPFLYPRNRFSDKHQAGLLRNLRWYLYKKAYLDIPITCKLIKEKTHELYTHVRFFENTISLNKESKKLTIINNIDVIEHDLNKLLWAGDKFEILGLELTFNISGNPIILIIVKVKDENDTTNYGFHYESIQLRLSKFYDKFYKLVKWFDEQILDRIFIIPTFTELDALESGWRKAFGIEICKEIKAQLKKDHYLYKYRITQIKEKFGYLHWYDEGSSREIQDIISKYEEISSRTCIVCGEPATKISDGWICPYCDKHFPSKSYIYKELKDGKWVLANQEQNAKNEEKV